MTNIYVVAHKEFELNKNLDECYKVIYVGKYAEECQGKYLSDNTGDNINEKNPNYCELTALYWIWKNDHKSDVVGICHYRRYFTKSIFSIKDQYYIKDKDIQKALLKKDIIVPKKEFSVKGMYKVYLLSGYKKDIEVLQEVIKTRYPDYLPYFQNNFIKANSGYFTNMCIMRKPLFDEYCKWLFDILSVVESKIDISAYPPKQARIFGYMSERLLGVWIAKNKIKVREYRTINIEDRHGLAFYFEEILKATKINAFVKTILFLLNKKDTV